MPAVTLTLSPNLDLTAALPLKTALLEHRGGDLTVDAGGVQRLGALCLQVLLAGARAWTEDGHAFRLEPRSEAFSAALTLFGADARFTAPGEIS